MTPKNKTTTLGNALENLIRSLGMERRLEEQQAVARWSEVDRGSV